MVHYNTKTYNQNYNYNRDNLRLHADETVELEISGIVDVGGCY